MTKKEKLKQADCELIEMYNLINNYGYHFEKNGKRYDLRHWLNCYGEEVDYYTLACVGTNKIFQTFDEAVEYIAKEC
jgi:hypothetical protein